MNARRILRPIFTSFILLSLTPIRLVKMYAINSVHFSPLLGFRLSSWRELNSLQTSLVCTNSWSDNEISPLIDTPVGISMQIKRCDCNVCARYGPQIHTLYCYKGQNSDVLVCKTLTSTLVWKHENSQDLSDACWRSSIIPSRMFFGWRMADICRNICMHKQDSIEASQYVHACLLIEWTPHLTVFVIRSAKVSLTQFSSPLSFFTITSSSPSLSLFFPLPCLTTQIDSTLSLFFTCFQILSTTRSKSSLLVAIENRYVLTTTTQKNDCLAN